MDNLETHDAKLFYVHIQAVMISNQISKPWECAANDAFYGLTMPELHGDGPMPAPVAKPERTPVAFDLEDELLREFETYDRPAPVVVEDIDVDLVLPTSSYLWTASDIAELSFVIQKDHPEFSPAHVLAEVRLTLGLNEEDMRQIEGGTVGSVTEGPLAELARIVGFDPAPVASDAGFDIDEEMEFLFRQPA